MHFFLDETGLGNIDIQNSSAFGPTSANVYNTSANFEFTSDTKAYACCDGQIIIQPHATNNNLVNIALKPHGGVNSPLDVAYFIYRGIKYDDLIDASGIIPSNSILDFATRMYNDNPQNLQFDVDSNFGFGFGTSLPSDTKIRDLFANRVSGYGSCTVTQGEHIGNFKALSTASFDVVLANDFLVLDVAYLQSATHQVDVSDPNLTSQQVKVKREEVTCFLSGAIFFGTIANIYYNANSNSNQNVSYLDSSQSLKAIEGDTIYSTLVQHLPHSNEVLVDIRSEYGYSYNFYNNYSDSSSSDISHGLTTSTLSDSHYGNTPTGGGVGPWPILNLDLTQATANQQRSSYFVKLRLDDNSKPLLYNAVHVRFWRPSPQFYYGLSKETPASSGWSAPVELMFWETEPGSSKPAIPAYSKFFYYREKNNTHGTTSDTEIDSSPNTVPESEKYTSMPFCSFDLPGLKDVGGTGHVKSSNPVYIKEKLHANSGRGNFGTCLSTGVHWDTTKVFVYSKLHQLNVRKISKKNFLPTYANKLTTNSSKLINFMRKSSLNFIVRPYEISSGNTINIPGINSYRPGEAFAEDCKEHMMMLGLTKSEFESVRDSGLLAGAGVNRMIYLEPDGNTNLVHGTDPERKRFYKYTLMFQAPDPSNPAQIAKATPTHQGSPITLYSRDDQMFSSSAFGATQSLTSGNHRIELTTFLKNGSDNELEGTARINDNIDFGIEIENYTSPQVHYLYRNTGHLRLKDPQNAGQFQAAGSDQYLFALELTNAIRRRRAYKDNPSSTTGWTQVLDPPGPPYNVDKVDANGEYINSNSDYTNVLLVTGAQGNKIYAPKKRYPDTIDWNRNGLLEWDDDGTQVFMVKMETENGSGEVNISDNNRRPLTDSEYDPFWLKSDDANIDFKYANTVRLYARVDVAAGVIGSLINYFNEIGHDNRAFLECHGFAYKDAHSYPSKMHVNGEAFDIMYRVLQPNVSFSSNQESFNEDVALINMMDRWGFNRVLCANRNIPIYFSSNWSKHITSETEIAQHDNGSKHLHDDHLHFDSFILNI